MAAEAAELVYDAGRNLIELCHLPIVAGHSLDLVSSRAKRRLEGAYSSVQIAAST